MTEKDNNVNPSLDELISSFDIPLNGSLGLLALGDLGLSAWRKVRREAGADDGIEENMETYEDNE